MIKLSSEVGWSFDGQTGCLTVFATPVHLLHFTISRHVNAGIWWIHWGPSEISATWRDLDDWISIKAELTGENKEVYLFQWLTTTLKYIRGAPIVRSRSIALFLFMSLLPSARPQSSTTRHRETIDQDYLLTRSLSDAGSCIPKPRRKMSGGYLYSGGNEINVRYITGFFENRSRFQGTSWKG